MLKNILCNLNLRTLYESEFFTAKKNNLRENNGDSGVETGPLLDIWVFILIIFHEGMLAATLKFHRIHNFFRQFDQNQYVVNYFYFLKYT